MSSRLVFAVLVASSSTALAAPPSPLKEFKEATLATSNPQRGTSETIEVKASGEARLLRTSKNAKFAPIVGRATKLELIRIKYMLLGARLETLPPQIPSFHFGPARPMTLEAKVGTKTYQTKADYDHYGSFDSRVRPLVRALRAVANRLKSPPPSFKKIVYTYRKPLTQYTSVLTLKSDGKVEVLRSSPTARYAPVSGHATAAELKALRAAFAKARVKTLPKTIPDPRKFKMPPANFVVASTIGSKTYETAANVDWFGKWKRLEPLVDALDALSKRITK